MKIMRKIKSFLLAVAILCLSMPVQAMAATQENEKIIIDLNQLQWKITDPSGNVVETSKGKLDIGEGRLQPGHVMTYYQYDGSDFIMDKGVKMAVNIHFDDEYSASGGVYDTDTEETTTVRKKEQNSQVFFTYTATKGNTHLNVWIENHSDKTIQITGGYIEMA